MRRSEGSTYPRESQEISRDRPDAEWWQATGTLKRVGAELIGPCPNCGGKDRFGVRVSDGLFNCRKCDDFRAILDAAGWESDWEPYDQDDDLPDLTTRPSINGTRRWQYHNLQGQTVTVTRTESPTGKIISRSPSGIRGPYMPLIRQPDNYNGPLVIVEGEVAADAVLEAGYAACCWPGGSGAIKQTDWSGIQNQEIVLWPDADEPGREAMDEILGILTGQGCDVRMVDVSDLSEKDDAVDVTMGRRVQLILNAKPAQAANASFAFNVVNYADWVDEPEPEHNFLVDGLVERGANLLFIGAAKTSKTLLMQHLAIRAGAGLPVLDEFNVPRKFNSLLVLTEGTSRGHKLRGKRIEEAGGRLRSAEVIYRPRGLRFDNREAMAHLGEIIAAKEIDLVVLDNWRTLSGGVDSNDQDSVSPMLLSVESALRAKRPDLTICLIHHAAKNLDGTRKTLTDMASGAGSFGAWFDTGLGTIRTGQKRDDPYRLVIEQRDLPPCSPLRFSIEDEHYDGINAGGWLQIRVCDDEEMDDTRRARAQIRTEAMEGRIIDYLRENPWQSRTKVGKSIVGRQETVFAACDSLVQAGLVVSRDNGRFTVLGVNEPATVEEAEGHYEAMSVRYGVDHPRTTSALETLRGLEAHR